MNDVTLLYLSANLIPSDTSNKIFDQLPLSDYPVVRIVQGVNYPRVGSSPYNYYKQILEGCCEATTEFVATCEDDTLYPREHFTHRPLQGFDYTYNINAWLGSNKVFWRSKSMNSFGFYISRRTVLIELLEYRFKVWPDPPSLIEQRHFHEPGVFEYDLKASVCHFSTKVPIIAFEHRGTLSGKRKRFGNPGVASLADYGPARSLYDSFWS